LHDEVSEFYHHEWDVKNSHGAYEKTLEKFGKDTLRMKCGKCKHDLDSHGFTTKTCFQCNCGKWIDPDEFAREIVEMRKEMKNGQV